jgi:protein-tyrosine phosphatase
MSMSVVLDLSWITPALAVGGRFATEHALHLARDHRVGAVIDLREEACDDELVLQRHGVAFLYLPTVDQGAVSAPMLRDGVAFAARHLDDGRRVLIHCQHGIGRSALLALCVLVERGWSPLDALALAKARRAVVSPSPAQYEAWAAWLRGRALAPPSFDEFAAIAYRHLRGETG